MVTDKPKSKQRFSALIPQVLVTPEMKNEVLECAKQKSMTLSDVVRQAIDLYLKLNQPESNN